MGPAHDKRGVHPPSTAGWPCTVAGTGDAAAPAAASLHAEGAPHEGMHAAEIRVRARREVRGRTPIDTVCGGRVARGPEPQLPRVELHAAVRERIAHPGAAGA